MCTCVCVVSEYLQCLCGPGSSCDPGSSIWDIYIYIYEVVCVCVMVVCGQGTPTEAMHTYCESSTAHMWKAWGHTRSKPQIIRMRKDLCLLRVSPSRSDMPRLPSHIHKCNYHHSTPSHRPPHQPTNGTGNRGKNYKGLEHHRQNRTAVVAWNWQRTAETEAQMCLRRGCCVHCFANGM